MRAKAVAVHLRQPIGDAARRDAPEPISEMRRKAFPKIHQRVTTADQRALEVEKDRAWRRITGHWWVEHYRACRAGPGARPAMGVSWHAARGGSHCPSPSGAGRRVHVSP